jgi:hypothetical protein
LKDGEKLRDYTPFLSPIENSSLAGYFGELAGAQNATNQTEAMDALVYLVDSLRQLSLQYAYFRAEALPQNDTIGVNISFAMLIRYFYLVEHEPTGNSGFQLDNTILGTYNFSDPNLKWNLTLQESNETDTDGNQYKFHWVVARTSDDVFTLRFMIAGHPVNVSGYEIRPDESKFDIRIRWYNNPLFKKDSWTTGPSENATNSKLALIGAYGVPGGELRRNDSVGDVHNSSEILFDNGTFVGFFRWTKMANISSNATSNNSSNLIPVLDSRLDQNALNQNSSKLPMDLEESFLPGWKKEVIAITFDAESPREIILDPQFGVRINYTSLDQQ